MSKIQDYELTVIIKENNHWETLDKVQDIVDKYANEVLKFEDDGLKTLSYPVDGEGKGYYYFWAFDTKEDGIKISKKVDEIEGVLRYLLVVAGRRNNEQD